MGFHEWLLDKTEMFYLYSIFIEATVKVWFITTINFYFQIKNSSWHILSIQNFRMNINIQIVISLIIVKTSLAYLPDPQNCCEYVTSEVKGASTVKTVYKFESQ